MPEPRDHFEIFPEKDSAGQRTGRKRWRLQAANGKITAPSGQSFRDATDVRRAIEDHVRAVLYAAGLDPEMPIELDIEEVGE